MFKINENLGPELALEEIAKLNRASDPDITEEDRQEMYDHLASFLRNAGIKPPDLMPGKLRGREERTFTATELRVAEDDGKRQIVGYAAVFDELSEELWGGFREKIQEGAFAKTIQEADVRALFNHDANYVLGRTKSGTLELREDDVGLAIAIDPPDTQWANDLVKTIDRGDVDQMSFAFGVIQDRWETLEGESIRTLEEVALYDISPVTFPAYPQTTVQMRSLLGVDERAFRGILADLESGMLSGSDRKVLEDFVERIQAKLTAEPDLEIHSEEDGKDQTDAGGEGSRHSRTLRYLENLRKLN